MIDLEAMEERLRRLPPSYSGPWLLQIIADSRELIAEVECLQAENEVLRADNIIMQEAIGGWADGSNWPP